MTKEVLKLALEAFDSMIGRKPERVEHAITAIKEALEKPQQEPVAYGTWDTMLGKGNRMMMVRLDKGQDGCTVPLYTHPLVPTAQPKQEPVAWAMLHDNGHFIDAIHPDEHLRVESEYTHPLYTTPPQRQWVGLTHEEHMEIMTGTMTTSSRMAAVEAKLREKNL